MNSNTLGTICAYLLVPMAVAIVFGVVMLVMVQTSYFPDTPWVQVWGMIAAAFAAAAVPMWLSLSRLRNGPLTSLARIICGAISVAVAGFGLWIIAIGDVKAFGFVLVGTALPLIFLTAESSRMNRV